MGKCVEARQPDPLVLDLPRSEANQRMKHPMTSLRLLLVGVVPRLAVAGMIVALLWAGFFWATRTPGGL